jgi:hypothetical protein
MRTWTRKATLKIREIRQQHEGGVYGKREGGMRKREKERDVMIFGHSEYLGFRVTSHLFGGIMGR